MISFKSIKAGFSIKNPAFFKGWLKTVVVEGEKRKIGDLQYIYCNDQYLLEINKAFLNHNTFTDVITFPVSLEDIDIVSGEIYISIDRVKANALNYNSTFHLELSRVMVHGLLHLIGYNDSTSAEKGIMRDKEDYYINLQPQINS